MASQPMELSETDSLRLNVLLSQRLQAVRIDESRMMVHGLSDRGEAKVSLNPNCRDEAYLKHVREFLSTQVLGSPGGYPVYLRRWTRMGQARDDSLQRLLLLGEPEAVVAVVHAPGLTDELARRAWWAAPTAENARRMLERDCVASGAMGPELAEHLLEFLPFEDDHQAMIDSVRLMLQPGLLDAERRQDLWNRGRRKNTYYVGFLAAVPDELPPEIAAHPDHARYVEQLGPMAEAGNRIARQLLRVTSAPGQAFLQTAVAVMKKPTNQDVVVALLEAIGAYFSSLRPNEERYRELQALMAEAESALAGEGAIGAAVEEVLAAVPDAAPQLRAMLILSMVGESLVAPIFGLTDAIGSVMRKRLEPVSAPLMEQFAALSGD
jgi:hypothetical protein